MLPTSPLWATYPLPNPKLIINWSRIRAASFNVKSLSGGGPELRAKPGSEGTMTWYGRLFGVYFLANNDNMGRNSRKEPGFIKK